MGYKVDSKITKIMSDLDIDEYEAANILQIPISDMFERVEKEEFRATPYLKLYNLM